MGRSKRPKLTVRRGGKAEDPIVLAWRQLDKDPCVAHMPLGSRVAVLAVTTPPYQGVDLSDGVPAGFDARVQELGAFLEQAGEIDPLEREIETVRPFVEELRAGILDLP